MVSISKDYELIDSFINRRRQVEYTDKLLDQLIHESPSSNRFSLSPGTSNVSVRRLKETEEPCLEHLSNTNVSEKPCLCKRSDSEISDVQVSKKDPDEKPLETKDFYMIQKLKDFVNIRSGSFSDMVVNGSFTIFQWILWIITHPTTRVLFYQIGMKIFELFVTIILAGIMIVMSIVTCGKDLEVRDKSNKGKEIVIMTPREVIRNPKPSTSHHGVHF